MATVSDQLLLFTILAYLAAMVAYAAEFAFRDRPALSPKRAPLVSAGVAQGPPAQESAPTGGPVWERSARAGSWGNVGRLGWAAVGALSVAAVLQLATAVTRGLAAERVPWGNMYEYALTATFVAVVAWFWVLYKHPGVRHLGLYVALVNVIVLSLAGMVAYTPVEPLVPALDSYWFLIHVAAAAFASGIFLIGFVAAVMYLIRTGYDAGKRRFPYPLGARVPGAEAIERLSFRMHAFGFPVWTFAVAAGAIWAEASWGRYWGWDPKEVWAFIAWVVYAAYLHARATPSVNRTVVAWLAVIGWLTVMVNLFGVNLFFESLHAYA